MRQKNMQFLIKHNLGILVMIVFALSSSLFGHSAEWSSALSLPIPADSVDSNGTHIGTEQAMFFNQLKSKDSISLKKNTRSFILNQAVNYELRNDYSAKARDQYFDLSGEVDKKNIYKGMSLGLEWAPILIVRTRNSVQTMDATIEAGPVFHATPFGVPLKLHGGGAGRMWDDSSTSNNAQRYFGSARDKGIYAGGELGDACRPLFTLPIYANVKGYAKSMSSSKLISAVGSLLWYHEMVSGDSVFASYSDSLLNGRDAILGQSNGKPGLIRDPRKIERSYSISAGFKGKKRLFIEPQIEYSFSRHSLIYPSQPQLLSNRENTDNALNVMIATIPGFPVTYYGGLRIDWIRAENLYDKSLFSVTNDDSFRIVLDAHSEYHVSMYHRAARYLQNGMGVEYSFDISRLSTYYPDFYVQGLNNDKDVIVSLHKLSVIPFPVRWGTTSLFYEYSNNVTNNIKKEMSAQNTIDWFYRVGATYKNTVFGRCTVSEATRADAKVTRYLFPSANIGNPPAYSRKWSSLFLCAISIVPSMNFTTEWAETYSDNGTWNGKEYLDTAVVANKDPVTGEIYGDYYAIDSKLWVHGIKSSLNLTLLHGLLIAPGFEYRINEDSFYDIVTRKYVRASNAGIRMSPSLITAYKSRHFGFKIGAVYNMEKDQNYWDLRVLLNGEF